jgi:hypothetical protein
MNTKILYLTLLVLFFQKNISAQDINIVVGNARTKIEKVKDYEAIGKMKTNVTFLKIPIASIKLYFKNPNKFKLTSEKGLSFVPKGSMSINLNTIFNGNDFTIIDAGTENIDKTNVRVAKLLPNDDNSDLVLTTLYIDPVNYLILKSKTTTKENGTYELKMKYKNYSVFGLPDEILFSFNAKDYKLPKGITFDFDDGTSNKQTAAKLEKNKKGVVEILVSKYSINKGLNDAIFK